jgi:hypothetical protein
MLRDALEHALKIALRGDTIQLTPLDETGNDRPVLALSVPNKR